LLRGVRKDGSSRRTYQGEKRGRDSGIQTKYLDPLKIRMKPMAMTDTAATRSPNNRVFMDRREAESPVKNRAGTVPSPKKIMVKKPGSGCWVVAAFTTMAQESMQGRKPVARPRKTLDAKVRSPRRREKVFPGHEAGLKEGRENNEKGITRRRRRPKRTMRMPPARLIPLRRPAKS
jgi:hypothetical protein